MGRRFFGLTNSHKTIFLDQIFTLMYYVGFNYTQAYNIPIWVRHWFIKRLNDEIKKANKANGGQGAPTRAAHHNTPDARALMGRYRSQVPANLSRFT